MDVNKMFEDNMKLVYLVYNRRIAKGKYIYDKEDDLIQEGFVGLYNGCCTYNPDFGIKPSTYLARCIENQMLGYIRTEDRAKRYITTSLNTPVTSSDDDTIELQDVFITDKEDQLSLTLTIEEMLKCYEKYIMSHGNKTLRNGIEKNKKLLKKILLLINCGNSYRFIAKKLGFSTTTLTNKINMLKKALVECNYV